MTNRVVIASVCLHVSAALYVAVGVLLVVIARDPDYSGELPAGAGAVLLAACLALAAGIEVVAYGLRRRKFWAWVAGLCVFGLYVPSLFFPLGVLGLWGLLAPGSRAAFGVGPTVDDGPLPRRGRPG